METDAIIEEFNARNSGVTITARQDAEGIVIGISCSLDYQLSCELQELLARVVETTARRSRMTLDLGGVSYISSTGVGALLQTYITAEKREIALVLRHVPRRVFSILDILGFSKIFTIEKEVEE